MAESVLFKEPLNGGLVTSRHPSMLRPGELTRADNVYYHPHDPSLRRARGRTVFGTVTAATKVKGIRALSYDLTSDVPAYIIAHVASKYKKFAFADRGDPGNNFTEIGTDIAGNGTTLDAVCYNNRHYLFNGNVEGTPNQVLKMTEAGLVYRRHGMAVVAAAPTAATAAGNWPSDPLYFSEGRFFFLYTEVLNPGTSDELESAFSDTLTPAFVDLQKDVNGVILYDVIITRPTTVYNTGATEWRVYMAKSPIGTSWSTAFLANAYQVGSGTITGGADTIRISNQEQKTGPNYSGNKVSETANPPLTITSGDKIRLNDNDPCSFNSTAVIGQNGNIVLNTFGFALPGTPTIYGIRVNVALGAMPGSVWKVEVDLSYDGTNYTAKKATYSASGSSSSFHVKGFGGPTDNWGRTWSAAEINSATNFRVRITATLVSLLTGAPYSMTSSKLWVDSIGVLIYTASGPTIGRPYPVITVREGNVLTVLSANTPPPPASTGDTLDGQMVTDDMGNRRRVVYSLPDKPDYFPGPYFIAPPSKEGDFVVAVRRVADVIVLGMRHQVLRLNALPRSTDPEFDKGRMCEPLSETHGIVSLQGVALFSPTDSAPLLAYVSEIGIKATDGSQILSLTEDLDWDSLVEVTKLDQAILVNYPKLYQLRFYFTPKSGSTNTQYMVIHYHPSHAKEGRKWAITGPCLCSAASAVCGRLLNEWVLLTGHNTDGKVYVEDNSDDDNADLSTGIVPYIETRDLYAAGLGHEWTLEAFWAFHNATSPAMTYTLTVRKRNTEGDIVNDATTKTFTTTKEGLSRVYPHASAECMRFKLTCADTGAGNNKQAGLMFIGYLGSGHGISER